jgi:hypothetical protein
MHSFAVLTLFLQRLDLAGAAQRPSTPDIDVSFLFEVGNLKVSQHGEAIVVGVVVVPLVAVRVDEENVVRELVVVVDDVAEGPSSADDNIYIYRG